MGTKAIPCTWVAKLLVFSLYRLMRNPGRFGVEQGWRGLGTVHPDPSPGQRQAVGKGGPQLAEGLPVRRRQWLAYSPVSTRAWSS